MSSSKPQIIAANWKMHAIPQGALDPVSPYRSQDYANVIVFPSYGDIRACVEAGLSTGGQCGRPEESGAFTGDVSMRMLKSLGCRAVLCGHSERRQHHEESDEFIAAQVRAAIDAGIAPILCIGETADQREMDETHEVIASQLSLIDPQQLPIIAYEPVWAVGTGKTPTASEIREAHAFIRSLFKKDTNILYGGSVNAGNAREILAIDGVDGALVGGASIKPEEFAGIVAASKR